MEMSNGEERNTEIVAASVDAVPGWQTPAGLGEDSPAVTSASGEDQVQAIAERLKAGEEVPSVTVRTFLSWFEAQRRGSFIVWYIRQVLAKHGLATVPDFESAWIDAYIQFALLPGREAPSACDPGRPEASGVSDVAVLIGGAVADPTHKVAKLDAANRGVVSVKPDDSITKAVTLMLSRNFSQLPVMTSDREVKGMISWSSIGARVILGNNCETVRDCTERAQEVSSDASLFSVIPYVAEHQYVLVRDSKDKKITGIVTASDLSVQFQQLAEPFLLLGEIEQQIRRLIEDRFTEAELAGSKDPTDTDRKITSVADLTIGECIRLLESEDKWRRVGLPIDRVVFIRDMHKVRNIRNDIMHFDPDPLNPADLAELRMFVRFLESLWDIGAAQKVSSKSASAALK